MLAQQEIIFPKLFTNIRSAMHPIIGFQSEEKDRKFKAKNSEDASEAETDEEPVKKGD